MNIKEVLFWISLVVVVVGPHFYYERAAQKHAKRDQEASKAAQEIIDDLLRANASSRPQLEVFSAAEVSAFMKLAHGAPQLDTPMRVTALVTAYCPCSKCCGTFSDGRTAWWGGVNSGDASMPGVAVDPKVIPYGTWIEIEGLRPLQADDTGSAMRRSTKQDIIHIDVRFRDHATALEWGRRLIPIWVGVAPPGEE